MDGLVNMQKRGCKLTSELAGRRNTESAELDEVEEEFPAPAALHNDLALSFDYLFADVGIYISAQDVFLFDNGKGLEVPHDIWVRTEHLNHFAVVFPNKQIFPLLRLLFKRQKQFERAKSVGRLHFFADLSGKVHN